MAPRQLGMSLRRVHRRNAEEAPSEEETGVCGSVASDAYDEGAGNVWERGLFIRVASTIKSPR